MRFTSWCASLIGCALMLVVMSASSAHAQATRTWVSGVGDDVNPCSRTAPCKTFAGAISKTAAGGEISVLDPGGFGAVTITKSISIVNYDSGEAGILASGTNGITVNAAGAVVYLRGLVIDGAPPGTPGLNGIRFLSGASLTVDNCVIKNFMGAAPNGFGINFQPSAAAKLFVTNTTITNNGIGTTGGGIQIAPTGAAPVNASFSNVQINSNTTGIRLDGTGSTSPANLTIANSVVALNSNSGVIAITAGSGSALRTILTNSTVSGSAVGITSTGDNATGAGSSLFLVGGSTVALNAKGVTTTAAGIVQSFKNNQIGGNNIDGTPLTAFPGPGGPLQ